MPYQISPGTIVMVKVQKDVCVHQVTFWLVVPKVDGSLDFDDVTDMVGFMAGSLFPKLFNVHEIDGDWFCYALEESTDDDFEELVTKLYRHLFRHVLCFTEREFARVKKQLSGNDL